jgi:hypothetical protein
VIPGSSADEESTRKPARPIVAVGRAGIGSVSVIAVSACGRSGIVAGTEAHAYSYPDLSLRIGQRKHQNSDQREIFEITHIQSPLSPIRDLFMKPTNLTTSQNSISKPPTHLNSEAGKKLQFREWLISAILAEFSHLRGDSPEPRLRRGTGRSPGGYCKEH